MLGLQLASAGYSRRSDERHLHSELRHTREPGSVPSRRIRASGGVTVDIEHPPESRRVNLHAQRAAAHGRTDGIGAMAADSNPDRGTLRSRRSHG